MERRFPPEPQSAPEARHFVLETGGSNDADENLRLATIVSEVVTNAILHAGTAFTVKVAHGEGSIRVEVTDDSGALPVKRSYGSSAATGRGLHIIEAMSDKWGVSMQDTGKTVWFELERQREAS